MLFATAGQGFVFLWMVGAGLTVGALCMFSAAVRRLLSAGLWLTLLVDALTGLCAGLVLVAALVAGSYGSLRIYELSGAAVGMALFRMGVEPLVRHGMCALLRLLRHFYDRIVGNRLIKVIFR